MDTGFPEKGATKENTRFSGFGTPIRSVALRETAARLSNLFLQLIRYFRHGDAWPQCKKTMGDPRRPGAPEAGAKGRKTL